MDVREKLVEIEQAAEWFEKMAKNTPMPMTRKMFEFAGEVLREKANSVTVPEWISVKDRLPETIPCIAGTAYSEAVNVLTTGRKVLTAVYDGTDFIADAEFWEAEGEEITHWTPVLLPLPQPPKGE